jgi:hypothetical protein
MSDAQSLCKELVYSTDPHMHQHRYYLIVCKVCVLTWRAAAAPTSSSTTATTAAAAAAAAATADAAAAAAATADAAAAAVKQCRPHTASFELSEVSQ